MDCKFCKGYSLCDVEAPGPCPAFKLKGDGGYIMLEADIVLGEAVIDPDGARVMVNRVDQEDCDYVAVAEYTEQDVRFVRESMQQFGPDQIQVYKADVPIGHNLSMLHFLASMPF